jgi:hypothetical protein
MDLDNKLRHITGTAAGNQICTQWRRDLSCLDIAPFYRVMKRPPWDTIKTHWIDRRYTFNWGMAQGNDCEMTPSDPAFQGKNIYMRSFEALYCLANDNGTTPIIKHAPILQHGASSTNTRLYDLRGRLTATSPDMKRLTNAHGVYIAVDRKNGTVRNRIRVSIEP